MIKISEEIQKIIYKFKYNEMAIKRKLAISKIFDLSYQFSRHICKIIIWGKLNNEWLKDWSDEIFNYLEQVSSIEIKDGKLKDKDYLDNFFLAYLGSKEELAKMLNKVYKFHIAKDDYPKVQFSNDEQLIYNKYTLLVNYLLNNLKDLEYNDALKHLESLVNEN